MRLFLFSFFFPLLISAQIQYPDSIYMRNGKGYACLITDLTESHVTIVYLDNNKIKTSLLGLEKLVLHDRGIIYQSEEGFSQDIKELQILINAGKSEESNLKNSRKYFSFGFFTEGTNIFTDQENLRFFPFSGVGLLFIISPLDILEIEIRFSQETKMFLPSYGGENYYVGFNYLLTNRYYITTIFSSHSNHGSSDGEIALARISLLGLGSGIKLNKAVSFEVSYNFVLNPKFWISHFDRNLPSNKQHPGESILAVAKMHFKFCLPF